MSNKSVSDEKISKMQKTLALMEAIKGKTSDDVILHTVDNLMDLAIIVAGICDLGGAFKFGSVEMTIAARQWLRKLASSINEAVDRDEAGDGPSDHDTVK
jgi:hypothetical protein